MKEGYEKRIVELHEKMSRLHDIIVEKYWGGHDPKEILVFTAKWEDCEAEIESLILIRDTLC